VISGAALKGIAVGSVAAMAVTPAPFSAVGRLRSAWAAEAQLDATLARVPAAPRNMAALLKPLRTAAAQGGVLVERASGAGERLQLRLSGSEAAVLALVNTAEPKLGLRFTRWSLTGEGSAVRLEGEAIGSSSPLPPARPLSRTLFGSVEDDQAPTDAPALVGIVGRIGQDAVAMVRLDDGGTRTLAIGESADGWTLESLAIDAAYFTRGLQRARVPLPAGE
jgi:hypothetical protein